MRIHTYAYVYTHVHTHITTWLYADINGMTKIDLCLNNEPLWSEYLQTVRENSPDFIVVSICMHACANALAGYGARKSRGVKHLIDMACREAKSIAGMCMWLFICMYVCIFDWNLSLCCICTYIQMLTCTHFRR